MSIAGIDTNDPADADNAGLGASSIRNFKTAVKAVFSGFAGLVKKGMAGPAATHDDLSALFDDVAALQAQIATSGWIIGEIRAYVGPLSAVPLGWALCALTPDITGVPDLAGIILIGANGVNLSGSPTFDGADVGVVSGVAGSPSVEWRPCWYIEYVGSAYNDPSLP